VNSYSLPTLATYDLSALNFRSISLMHCKSSLTKVWLASLPKFWLSNLDILNVNTLKFDITNFGRLSVKYYRFPLFDQYKKGPFW